MLSLRIAARPASPTVIYVARYLLIVLYTIVWGIPACAYVFMSNHPSVMDVARWC